jgi:hypothetical protein
MSFAIALQAAIPVIDVNAQVAGCPASGAK